MRLNTAIRCALLSAILLASGCASIPRATEDGKIKSFWSQISTKDFIRVRGIGIAPRKFHGYSLTARRGSSRNAALVAARFELLAVIKGVKLEGGVSISQLMDTSSVVREIANDLVKGGEEVQTEWTASDDCVVTLELKRSTVERLIQKDSPRERALSAQVEELQKREAHNKAVILSMASDYYQKMSLIGVTIHMDSFGVIPDNDFLAPTLYGQSKTLRDQKAFRMLLTNPKEMAAHPQEYRDEKADLHEAYEEVVHLREAHEEAARLQYAHKHKGAARLPEAHKEAEHFSQDFAEIKETQ